MAICFGCFFAGPKGSASCCFLSLFRTQLIRSDAYKITPLLINLKPVNWLRTLITPAKSLVLYEIPPYSWGSTEGCYRICTPGGRNLRRYLWVLPTTMRWTKTTRKSIFIVGLKVTWVLKQECGKHNTCWYGCFGDSNYKSLNSIIKISRSHVTGPSFWLKCQVGGAVKDGECDRVWVETQFQFFPLGPSELLT